MSTMKKHPFMPRLFSVKRLICLSLFVALAAKSQWLPNGPPHVLEHEFVTAGGITYFRLVGLLPGGSCCQRIAGHGVSRQGTVLSQILEQEIWGDICIELFCEAWVEESVSVLGALAPGSYNLTLLAGTSSPIPLPPSPWASLSFTVPTNSSPTLSMSPVTNTGGLQLLIQLAGVSNVTYVLESSTNLVNWAGIKTNFGAPVTFSVAATGEPRRYYRAAIFQAPPPDL
jgi:hypothetical protein